MVIALQFTQHEYGILKYLVHQMVLQLSVMNRAFDRGLPEVAAKGKYSTAIVFYWPHKCPGTDRGFELTES